MTRSLQHTKPLLAALLGALALLAAAPAANAAPAALQTATQRCWLDVINDWVAHQPNVVGTYAIPCYTQAIQHLNSMSDIRGYSSAPDDIHRALLAAIREQRNDGGPGGPSGPSTSGPGPGGGSTPGGPGGKPGSGPGGGSSSGHHSFLGIGGPSDATSIPLPLIVLGALAILLALAALGTWLARRFQGRRPAPAPAVSRRR